MPTSSTRSESREARSTNFLMTTTVRTASGIERRAAGRSAHTFRTTVGDLVTKGVNGTEAANILGHARASMTYDRYSDRRQRPMGAVGVLADVAS